MAYKPYIEITHDGGTERQDAINSGDIYNGDSVYITCHDGVGEIVTNDTDFLCSQFTTSGPAYRIQRGGISFPVSTGLTVTSASIFLWGSWIQTVDGHFDAVLVDGSDLGDTLVEGDYQDLLNETTSYGSINTADFVEEGWNEIALNASGITALQNAIASGRFRLGLRNSDDIAGNASAGDGNYCVFYGSDADSSLSRPQVMIID